MNRVLATLAIVFGIASGAGAQVTIPDDQRITARVVRTIDAPADAPMQMPTDVAVGRNGKVYVADGVNRRVVCFSADHAFETALTHAGDQAFLRPLGLDVDGQYNLWITDAEAHAVYTGQVGTSWQAISLTGKSAEQPFDVTGVAVTEDGSRAYIVDNDNHRIAIRDNATGDITFVGGPGEGLGQLRWPFLVAIDREGDVFVTEAVGARVQRLLQDGSWGGSISRWGVELGHLYRPKGISIDARGRIFVSDSTLGVVQVFTKQGKVEGVLCDANGSPLRFDHPMGMCFDSSGRLLVVELASNRVAVVELVKPPTDASNPIIETPDTGKPDRQQ